MTKETENEMYFEFHIYEKKRFYPERMQEFLELRGENGSFLHHLCRKSIYRCICILNEMVECLQRKSGCQEA